MERLVRMDGLRGVLAVYVMLGHAVPFTCISGWGAALVSHGEAAVDLFFCLSGLVLVNSLERFEGRFFPFMLARARRLLPVYFLVLGLAVLLLVAGDPLPEMPWVGPAGRLFWAAGLPGDFWAHLVAHLGLVQGLIPAGLLPYVWVTLLGPAWSLSTEWQFYVVMGLVAPKRLGLFALGLLLAGALYHGVRLPPEWQLSRAFLLDAAPWFSLGLATAVLVRRGGGWLFVVCLLGAFVLAAGNGPGKGLVPLAWGLVVAAQFRPWGRVLEHPVLQYLGAISYPLYLVNEPVQRGLAMVLAPLAWGDAEWFTLVWLPVSIVTALAAASLLHNHVERAFMRRRQKILLPVIAPPLNR